MTMGTASTLVVCGRWELRRIGMEAEIGHLTAETIVGAMMVSGVTLCGGNPTSEDDRLKLQRDLGA